MNFNPGLFYLDLTTVYVSLSIYTMNCCIPPDTDMKREMELTHPGEMLKIEIVEGRSLTIAKAAGLLGVTRATLSNILNGKAAITPNIALRVEAVFGGAARFWVRLQSSYDLSIAEKGFMENPPNITRYD